MRTTISDPAVAGVLNGGKACRRSKSKPLRPRCIDRAVFCDRNGLPPPPADERRGLRRQDRLTPRDSLISHDRQHAPANSESRLDQKRGYPRSGAEGCRVLASWVACAG